MINLNMRPDVAKVVFPTGYDEKSNFQNYAAIEKIGENILNSLFTKTIKEDIRVNNESVSVERFFSDAKNQKTGFLSTVYACTGILSLMNRFGVELNENRQNTLKHNILWLLDYVYKNGYTLDPYINDSLNLMFDKEGNNYIGAMTWMLSLLTSVRSAMREDRIKFDNQEKINNKIKQEIKNIIQNFINYCVGANKENMEGWGFTRNAAASLFFTYSVLEAYSDFEDNVFPSRAVEDEDSDIDDNTWRETMWDIDLLEYLGYDTTIGADVQNNIITDWKNKCQNVSMRVWETYKDVLKTDFVSDGFLKKFSIVTKEDMLKSNSSNALFNNIYLVFILIYGYVNVRVDENEKEDVIMTMNAALQNVQRVYEQLKKEGYSHVIDNYIIPFGKIKGNDQAYANLVNKLNYEMLIDAKITPTLVKANNMIAFYITQYPVKEMSSLFEDLFVNMDDNEWVWDSNMYDVKNTERYIEAIGDFYKYYNEYEKKYVAQSISDQALRDEIRKELQDALAKQAEENNREKFEEEKSKAINNTKKGFCIENAITEKIENMLLDVFSSDADKNEVACKLTERVENIIQEAIYKIQTAKSDEDVILTAFENRLSNFFEQIIIKTIENKYPDEFQG